MNTIVLRGRRIARGSADGWPARCWSSARRRARCRPAGPRGAAPPRGGHVLDRDDHLEVERLAGAGIDDLDVPARPDAAEERAIASSGRWVADSPIRCIGLRAGSRSALQALQAEREVGPALGAGDGVDLVDDHVLDAAEDLARLAGQEEVQALGRRDQDVRRVLREVAAGVGRGVAGTDADGDVRRLFAQPLGGQSDPGQGGAGGCVRRRRRAP